MEKIGRHQLGLTSGLLKMAMVLVKANVYKELKMRVDDINPLKSCPKIANLPGFFIHGRLDELVPVDDCQ